MKIVAVHTDFRLYWIARLTHFAKCLSERGHELHVLEIAGKGSPYAFAGNETSGKLWECLFPDREMESLSSAEAKHSVVKRLDGLNPDVILCGAIAFPSGAAAVDWAKRNGKAVVMFDDAKKESVQRNLIVNTVKRLFYSCVDAVLCPSSDWNETFQYWGFEKRDIFYGVDVVDNDYWKSRDYKKSSDIILPERFFLCVGRQIPCKNFSIVVEAYKELVKKAATEQELVFVGDGPERENLESLVPFELRNKIHFLPFKAAEPLREIYHRADCLILPSISETWGLVVNEAMAAGLPVIVSKQCGCANTLVSEGQNGFAFDAFDKEELSEKMRSIVASSEAQRKEMGNHSLQVISAWGLERFSDGSVNAVEYAFAHRKKANFLVKALLKRWNGAYNPV